MKNMLKGSDEDFNDFFDGPEIEEKEPELTPEQIEDKIDEEETIVLHTSRWQKLSLILLASAVLFVTGWVYFRYYSPYVEEAQERGFVMKIEKRGTLWKTYEGELVSETLLGNSDVVSRRDFTFSIENDSLAHAIMQHQATGKPVTLKYKSYTGTLPWRGESCNIVISIE